MKELIYTEHEAGDFEDGLQICILCGKVITDYTGSWVSSDNSSIRGFAQGKVWQTGTNPVQTMGVEPLRNYGDGDPFIRKIIKCV